MYRYTIDIYEQGSWRTLEDVALPITDGAILDDTLDEGRIDIRNTERIRAIRPFQRIRIKCYENDVLVKTLQRVVGTAKCTRKRNAGTPLYDWSIQTLELTKLLERETIGSMTATKYLKREYDTLSTATPTFSITGVQGTITLGDAPTYKMSYATGTTIEINQGDWITLSTPPSYTTYSWLSAPHTSVTFNGQAVDITDGFTPTQVGVYTITTSARASWTAQNESGTTEVSYVWLISTFKGKASNKPFTITSVVERLLYAGVTRRWETQKYTLDTAFATKYAEVEAPEFAFTNSTLLDALFQIGGKIHAIPRLVASGDDDLDYILTFDELGGNEEVGNQMPQWVYEEKSIDINDFCDTLDSPAQNLVNSVNVEKGCISEFGDQYITIRTENSQVEISADTMAVRTTMPIKQMVKCQLLYDGMIFDITPYVYEMAEYNTLSTLYTSTYPYSKGYALCYSIGGNTITGLNNKQTTPTILEGLGEQYAIINILNAVSGGSYTNTGFDYINLAFRVTYVPIVSARVTQKKPLVTDTNGNTLFYNQGANLVETSAFGQKMRGAIARLGLTATRRTYDFETFADLPEVGQKIDGEYIAQVDCAYYPTKIRATVLLTPNFNQLSQYVGLDTNYRLYDVSERQMVDRFLTYGETIEVGDNDVGVLENDTILSVDLLQKIVASTLADTPLERIDTAMTISYDDDGNEIEDSAVLLPVASFPFGQSLAFVCAFLDNYGAGYQATDRFGVEGAYKRVQRLVPYADSVGELDRLAVFYGNTQAWHNANEIGDNKQSALYPQATDTTRAYYEGNSPLNTRANPFIVSKDSSEKLGLTYQIHFQANRESIVIGAGFTENCPLVTNITIKPRAYAFTHELNNLSSIDLASEIANGTAKGIMWARFGTAKGTVISPMNLPENTKAWALVDDNNNIYVGENTTEEKPIYFTIKQGA